MNKFLVATLVAVLALSACDGDGTNPFDDVEDEETDTDTDTDTDADGITR